MVVQLRESQCLFSGNVQTQASSFQRADVVFFSLFLKEKTHTVLPNATLIKLEMNSVAHMSFCYGGPKFNCVQTQPRGGQCQGPPIKPWLKWGPNFWWSGKNAWVNMELQQINCSII